MKYLDNIKQNISFTGKLRYLKLMCFLASFAMAIIPDNSMSVFQTTSGILLSIVVLFIVTAILSGVLNKIKITSNQLYDTYLKKINTSIQRELKAKRINIKLQLYNDRLFLYQYAKEIELKNFRNALIIPFLLLIIVLFLSFFNEFSIPIVHQYETPVWFLTTSKIMYILTVVATYFIIKLLFFFDETIRRNVAL